MYSDLKVGIAGYGIVGKKRKKILDNIPGIKIIAISDKNPKNRISSKKIKFFNDYNKLFNEDLLGEGSRVVGLTSEGNYVAMNGYGPVSVAKVAMEAIIRQIGWELGKYGITANAVQAGVTPTRALTKITQDWEEWVEKTKIRNPMKRTTTPEDIANTISLLLRSEADFINCSIIYCDGGEHRSGMV